MNKQHVRQTAGGLIKMIKNVNTLPLPHSGSLAVIGELAAYPGIRSYEDYDPDSQGSRLLFEELAVASRLAVGITYARGYSVENDFIDMQLAKDAIDTACDCDSIIILAGTTDNSELPESQTYLIEKLIALGKRLVIVVFSDAPLEFSWLERADCVFAACWGEQETARMLAKMVY